MPGIGLGLTDVAARGAGGGGVTPDILSKTVTVNNASGASQTDYQVRVPITWSSGMRSDFGDVRFPDASAYWIDPDSIVAGVSATAWIKMASLAAASVDIALTYAGGRTATTGDGTAVFEMFDDFQASGLTFDAAKWALDKSSGYQRAVRDTFRTKRKVGLLASNGDNVQGICVNNNILYAVEDGASESVDATIHRYDISVAPEVRSGTTALNLTQSGSPASFACANHGVNLDFRWDSGHEGNILAGPGPIANNKIWEIGGEGVNLGVKLRTWTVGGVVDFAGANSSAFPAYYAPGQILCMTNDAVGASPTYGTHRIRVLNVNSDEGVTGGAATFTQGDYWDFSDARLPTGRRQGFKYYDGYVYFMFDDASPDTTGGTILKIQLTDAVNHIATVVDEYDALIGNEREDLARDAVTGKWYYIIFSGPALMEFEFATKKEAQLVSQNNVSTAQQSFLRGLTAYGTGYKSVSRWKGNGCYPGMAWTDDVTEGTAFDVNTGLLIGRLDNSVSTIVHRRKNSGTQTNTAVSGTSEYFATFREWQHHRISSTVDRIVIDGTTVSTVSTSVPTGSYYPCVGTCGGTGNAPTDLSYTGMMSVTFFAVGKAQAAEPTVTGG